MGENKQKMIMDLTTEFDNLKEAMEKGEKHKEDLADICESLFTFHAAKNIWNRGVMGNSRPATCKANPNGGPCRDAEKWYMNLMNRKLFAFKKYGNEKGKKGRGHKSETSHAKKCNKAFIATHGGHFAKYMSPHVGTTVEDPQCAVTVPAASDGKESKERSPLPRNGKDGAIGGIKQSMYGYWMTDDIIAKHFMYCSVPFTAGISGSIPQYMLLAAGSPALAKGKEFKDALSDEALLTIIAMLETFGFHTLTELILPVNFYKSLSGDLP